MNFILCNKNNFNSLEYSLEIERIRKIERRKYERLIVLIVSSKRRGEMLRALVLSSSLTFYSPLPGVKLISRQTN